MKKKPSTCKTGKRRFRDEIAARLALGNAVAVHRQDGTTPERAYRCQWCRGWHLTSQAYKPRKPATAEEPAP